MLLTDFPGEFFTHRLLKQILLLVSICERSKNESLELYPHVQVVRSFEELIANPQLELIIVNTPDITHYDYCKAALEAGKHVIVEKPFAFTVKEGAELVELAEKKRLLLTVFQNRRWDCDFLTMQKLLKENRLGRIVEFRSSFQRYKNQVVDGSWKEKKNRFVGIVYNLGPHLVDQAVCLFGKPDGVFAQIRVQRDNSQVDDFFQITLIYKEIHVLLTAGLLMKEPTANFVLHGTQGSFVKYGIDPQEDQLKRGMKPTDEGYGIDQPENFGILHTEIDGNTNREQIQSIPGDYMQFFNNVALSIRQQAFPAISAKENLLVIKILEAAFQSQEENKVIFFI